MVQGILFTDDEIVALAAIVGRPWPTGLPTVASTPEALLAAATRGVRSLSVRGMLVTESGGEGFVVDPAVNAPIEALTSSGARIGAYIAPASDPMQLAGASITAAPGGAAWWLDATTPQGVHGIRQADQDEVLAVIDEMAAQTQSGALLGGAHDPTAYLCVIRYGSGPDEIATVVPGSEGVQWDRSVLARAVSSVSGAS